ncbi:hypothetical protein ES319_D07G084400v1 [Gossypium barbadense]|uniref:Uncharacterized protein n=2 Tax=Gossypium TaxID=3633 RepID=A0A5J5QNL9_GOSBA|nr:hypothetical protein ES319_D07G084400v1 [Gossypium barbadense]TYG60711.1 hypothetical protein ES288_D07G089100v1 [Gossypium darwinii]
MALTISPFSLPYIHKNPSNFHHKLKNRCLSSIKTHQIQSKSGLFPIFCTSKPSTKNLKTCKNCKTQFDPLLNHPRACHFHTAHFGGETKRKFESVYAGGTMDTPESGKVFHTGIVVALKIHLILDVLLLLMLLTTTNAGSPLSSKTDAGSVSL